MHRAAVTIVVVTMLAAGIAAGTETRWIPAAASNPGLHGTVWTTDLWLFSQVNDADVDVTATFFADQLGTVVPAQVTITLPPSRPVEIRDAVATLFGEHRPGSIRLEAQYPFYAQSRTANSGSGEGSYGQGIPAYEQDVTAAGYTLLGAANRPGTDGIRSNIGIANTSDTELTINILARDPDTGDQIGTTTVDIGPYGWFQDDLFELLGAADQTIELADVSVWPAALAMTYLSRVDNRSGDGTFIFGSSGPSIAIGGGEPRYLWVRTTLTYDPEVTLYWFKWWGPNGPEWVRGPQSGYVTEPFQIQLPMDYCVKVIGMSGLQLTKVTVSIQSRETGGEWSGGRTSYGTTGRGPIDHVFCKQFD